MGAEVDSQGSQYSIIFRIQTHAIQFPNNTTNITEGINSEAQQMTSLEMLLSPASSSPLCLVDVMCSAASHDGTLVPLELVLNWMVSCPGFCGIVQLLDWFKLPDDFTLVMEHPEHCQDLWHFLEAGGFLPKPMAWGLFRQVLQAVQHRTSCDVLHRHIKAENVLVDLASGEVKLIDLGCGTILQDTFYTWMAGTREYYPPEWTLFGCYHGHQPATIWSLGILLYQLVCGHLPLKTREDIVQGQLFFPPQVSHECQHLIRWCLSMDPADRPCLEDILQHSWLQETHLAQETAEIHPSLDLDETAKEQSFGIPIFRRELSAS
uniref:non-specific serine/threonine protein kinase n=1 Tax=Ficedula albicollis TaxID=59894 RepID=U3KGW4_FICAL